MTLESVLIKLGVDASQVEPALLKTKLAVNDTATHTKRAFYDMGGEGGKFKKLLSEISGQFPLIGIAAQAAFSLIGGALAAATVAFTFFKGKIEEWDKEMDAIGERNAKRIGSWTDSLRDASEEFRKRKQEWQDWFYHVDSGENEFLSVLKDELEVLKQRGQLIEDTIQKQVRLGKIGGDQGAMMSWRAQMALAQSAYHAAYDAVGNIAKGRSNAEDAAKADEAAANDLGRGTLMKDIPRRITDLQTRGEELKKDADAKQKHLDEYVSYGQSINDIAVNIVTGRHYLALPDALMKTAKEAGDAAQAYKQNEAAIESHRKTLAELTKTQDEADRKAKHSQEKVTEYNKAFDEAAKTAKKTKEDLEALSKQRPVSMAARGAIGPGYVNDQFMPDLARVAQTGRWMQRFGDVSPHWEPAPFARIAGEYLSLEEQAMGARAWGNVRAFNSIVARRSMLGDTLRNVGLLPRENATEESLKVLQEILNLAKPNGGGLTINPRNGD